MGYTHGKQWSEEEIKSELAKLIKEKGLSRMLTLREMIISTGGQALSNAVTRSGGVRKWANELNVLLTHSNTRKGWEGEEKAKIILEQEGFTVDRMTARHPFDLLVNDVAKVDVKCAEPHTFKCGAQAYCYHLEKKIPTCDFYMLIANGREKGTVFIVPASNMRQKQISIGMKSSVYDKFVKRFDILRDYCSFVKTLR